MPVPNAGTIPASQLQALVPRYVLEQLRILVIYEPNCSNKASIQNNNPTVPITKMPPEKSRLDTGIDILLEVDLTVVVVREAEVFQISYQYPYITNLSNKSRVKLTVVVLGSLVTVTVTVPDFVVPRVAVLVTVLPRAEPTVTTLTEPDRVMVKVPPFAFVKVNVFTLVGELAAAVRVAVDVNVVVEPPEVLVITVVYVETTFAAVLVATAPEPDLDAPLVIFFPVAVPLLEPVAVFVAVPVLVDVNVLVSVDVKVLTPEPDLLRVVVFVLVMVDVNFVLVGAVVVIVIVLVTELPITLTPVVVKVDVNVVPEFVPVLVIVVVNVFVENAVVRELVLVIVKVDVNVLPELVKVLVKVEVKGDPVTVAALVLVIVDVRVLPELVTVSVTVDVNVVVDVLSRVLVLVCVTVDVNVLPELVSVLVTVDVAVIVVVDPGDAVTVAVMVDVNVLPEVIDAVDVTVLVVNEDKVRVEVEKLVIVIVLVVSVMVAEERLMSVLVRLEEYGVVPVLVITDPYVFEDSLLPPRPKPEESEGTFVARDPVLKMLETG
ncbi:hypothetical protein M434DRAFT_14484 [Hypoxylon sp. CO27-5]|nr:hypothetical protein M434DRAFT_14484 [Hypoxylon sp. CO27-5]